MIAGNEKGGSRAVKRSPCFSMAQLVKIDLVDVGQMGSAGRSRS